MLRKRDLKRPGGAPQHKEPEKQSDPPHGNAPLESQSILTSRALLSKLLSSAMISLLLGHLSCGPESAKTVTPLTLSPIPLQVKGLPSEVVQIVGYHYFAGFCALLRLGEVYCWGSVEAFIYLPGMDGTTVALRVPGISDIKQLGGGGGSNAICGLNSKNEAFCFGSAGLSFPNPITLENGESLVTLMDDSLTGGLDQYGNRFELYFDGINPTGTHFAYADRNTDTPPAIQFSRTLGGSFDTSGYAEVLTDGTVVCTTMNCGQAFDTNEIVRAYGEASSYQPQVIDGIPPAVHVSFSCAVGSDGLVYCWGANPHGELGTGDNQWFRPPFRPVVGVTKAKRVMGAGNYRCAITESGELWCWGALFGSGKCDHGEYELEVSVGHDFPDHVYRCEGVKPPEKVLDDVADVAIILGTACAVKKDGDVYCWGYNYEGQLGIGGPLPKQY